MISSTLSKVEYNYAWKRYLGYLRDGLGCTCGAHDNPISLKSCNSKCDLEFYWECLKADAIKKYKKEVNND